ncbi:MAG: outer membrane lipoprotein-sorting protein [Rectinemataceae bacterium]
MKRKITMLAAVAALLAANAYAQSASELLARSDAERTISDMSFDVRLVSFDGGRTTAEDTLWGFVKVGSDHNRVLMYFAQPASERGRKLLVDGDTVYLLFPRTTNPIRLSPLQTLIGQASDGDVVRTFASDYDVDSLSDASLDGVACYRFELTAKEGVGDSSYKHVRLWIDRSSLNLRYAEFFADSGVLLKKAHYADYRRVEGKNVPFEVDIYTGDDPRKHTTMTFLKVGEHPVPETEFRRDYLVDWVPGEPR